MPGSPSPAQALRPNHYPFTLLAAADPVLSATIQYRGGPARRQAAQHLAAGLSAALCAFVDKLGDPGRRDRGESPPPNCNASCRRGTRPEGTTRASRWHRAVRTPRAQTPDNVAVIHGERSWTYAELAREAACVREWLQDTGVRRGDKVAIAVTRSMSCLAAILGIWLARAVYVPVDPALPASRVDMILEDSAPVVVITQTSLTRVRGDSSPGTTGPSRSRTPTMPYAFFTSGSTGRPKGSSWVTTPWRTSSTACNGSSR